MTNIWIVVAESSRARLFSLPNCWTPPKEIAGFTHANARLRAQDLITDAPAPGNEDAAHKHEAQLFAEELCERLETARGRGQVNKLIVVAAPGFLGLLRKAMPGPLSELVIHSVNKNLVRHDADAIRQHLPERF